MPLHILGTAVSHGPAAGPDLFATIARMAWRHARMIATVAVMVLLAAPMILAGLRVDSDSSRLLPPDDPLGRSFRAHRQRFGEAGPLLVLLHRGEGNKKAFDTFTQALGVTLRQWDDIRFVDFETLGPSRHDEIEQRLRASLSRATAETVRNLATRFDESGMTRQLRRLRKRLVAVDDPDARARMLADPLGFGEIFEGLAVGVASVSTGRYIDSPDGSFRIIWVQPSQSAEDGAYCVDLMRRLDALVEDTRTAVPGAASFGYQVSGVHAVTAESAEVLVRQMAWITIIAAVAVVGLLWLAFRETRATILCFAPLLVSQIVVLCIARFFFNPVYSWSIGYVAIAMGLGLDVSLHLTSRFYSFLDSCRPTEALEKTYRDCGAPILVGVLSTAVAFLAVLLARGPGLRQMAVLTSIGLVVTVGITFVLFPVLVRALKPGRRESRGPYPGSQILKGVFANAARRPLPWCAVALAVGIAALPFAARSELDLSALNLIPSKLRAVEAGMTVAEAFGGSFVLTTQVTVSAPDLRSALDAQQLVDEELETLVGEDLVAGFATPSSLIPYPPPLGDTEAAIAELETAVAAGRGTFFHSLEELGFRQNPDFATYYDTLEQAVAEPDPGSAESAAVADRLGLYLAREDGRVYLQTTLWPTEHSVNLDTLDEGALQDVTLRLRALGLPPQTDLEVTGILQVYQQVNAIVPEDLRRIAWVGAALVAGVVLVFFSHFGTMLLCLVPLAAAIPTTLALATALDARLTQTAVCFIAVVVGIGIDDAVHVLVRLRRRPEEEAGAVVREIGPILTLTTLSTAVGFGCLTFSTLPVVAEMGELIAIGVVACWFFSVFLLPGLHRAWHRGGLGRSTGVLGVLICATAVAPQVAGASDDSVDEVIQRLQKRWEETEALTCTFVQTKTIQALESPVVLEGRLFFMKPMLLRLDLTGDENLLFITDGQTMWIHDRDLNEIQEMDFGAVRGSDPTSSLPMLTTGPEHLEEEFEVTGVDEEQGRVRLVLLPRETGSSPETERIELVLDRHLRLRYSTVRLRGGDVAETEYHKWERSEGFSKDLFKYHSRVE